MALAQDVSKDNEKAAVNERLSDFFQKNRRKIFIVFIAVLLLLAGFIITLAVRDKMESAAMLRLDALNSRYEALKDFIGSGENGSRQDEIAALLEDLAAFGKKSFGFAAARSYCMTADIYWARKEYNLAERAWTEAVKAAKKSYLAPIAAYNAAAAAEEQGNIDSAIAYYRQALNYGDIFSGAAKAQFSIGRLEESRNNKAAALEAYRTLAGKWPDDPLWENLAQSRIVVLSD